MKTLLFYIFLFFCGYSLLRSCSSSSSDPQVVTVTSYAADGLDLRAVGNLFKKSSNVEDFERKLNSSSLGINNLDLDENGSVDFIHAQEFQGGGADHGVALYTILGSADTQEVATISITKSGNDARMDVYGNQQIYGHSHYHSSFGLAEGMILGYLLSSHTPYYSPFGYNRYPDYYGRGWTPRSSDAYQRGMNTYRDGSFQKTASSPSQVKSPLSNKTSQQIKAPLKNPTSTQRAFQARNPSKSIAKGGFGRSGSVRGSLRSGSRIGGGK